MMCHNLGNNCPVWETTASLRETTKGSKSERLPWRQTTLVEQMMRKLTEIVNLAPAKAMERVAEPYRVGNRCEGFFLHTSHTN